MYKWMDHNEKEFKKKDEGSLKIKLYVNNQNDFSY